MLWFGLGIVVGRLYDFYKSNKSNKSQDIDKNVNHPKHYLNSDGKECIEIMRNKYGDDAVFNFCILNVYKYKFRAGNKKGNSYLQDMKKAAWYENYAQKLENQ